MLFTNLKKNSIYDNNANYYKAIHVKILFTIKKKNNNVKKKKKKKKKKNVTFIYMCNTLLKFGTAKI